MTNDNVASVVPNSKIVNQNFLNWSYRERRVRLSVAVGVATDSDVDAVTGTLLRATEGVQFVLDEPKPTVQFMDFGDYDLKFRVLFWTDKPRRHLVVKSAVRYNIHRLFKEAGIDIPNPQRDLTLRGGSLRLDGSGLPDAAEDGGAEAAVAENPRGR
jgi:small-conductance mechanosensitive channel